MWPRIMWPRISFDPLRLFDLHITDLLYHDPYYARMWPEVWERLGEEFLVGLLHAPQVVGYLCEVCPERAQQLRQEVERVRPQPAQRVQKAEARIVDTFFPWNLGMAKSPETWDALPWSCWDPSVIHDRVDLEGKTVLDIGAGTGQVTLRCAPYAESVIALEPVARLRRYMEQKMAAAGLHNVLTLEGVLESVPLSHQSVDAAISSNGSFGWSPDAELRELERIIKPGGTILLLAPCNYDNEAILAPIRRARYQEFEFEVPCDSAKPGFIKSFERE